MTPCAGLVDAGQVLSACFDAGVDLVLHGHVHAAWFSELLERETFAGYACNEIDVLYEDERVLWWPRPVAYEGGGWKEGDELGPFGARAG